MTLVEIWHDALRTIISKMASRSSEQSRKQFVCVTKRLASFPSTTRVDQVRADSAGATFLNSTNSRLYFFQYIFVYCRLCSIDNYKFETENGRIF